jgi:multisubunit Na+/H+ antiporter MnhB subunit
VKNAIDVIRMKISIERGRETIELQHESISLQVAAGFIEFIVVFYYTLNSWKILAGKVFSTLSPGVILITLTAFSSSVVLFTHAVAAARKEKKRFTAEMATSLGLILLFTSLMFLLTLKSP